ncbi:MAG: hypothetical protein MUD01_01260 [Chloroflexaceae bacterium]|jgi:hypothetical protein|nr:hypothetical protein [Chloroflexaceae bacterium]
MQSNEADSVQRVRRGCVGIVILLTAIIVSFIFATGNLAISLFFIIPALLLVLRRYIT